MDKIYLACEIPYQPFECSQQANEGRRYQSCVSDTNSLEKCPRGEMLRIVLEFKMNEAILGCSFSFLINATMLQKQPAAINDRIQLFSIDFSCNFRRTHRLAHAHTNERTNELDFRCIDNIPHWNNLRKPNKINRIFTNMCTDVLLLLPATVCHAHIYRRGNGSVFVCLL